MTGRTLQDLNLDDSSDLEDSWAAEDVMLDGSPSSRKTLSTSNLKNGLFHKFGMKVTAQTLRMMLTVGCPVQVILGNGFKSPSTFPRMD
jgi:hypothetical protein